MPRIFCFDMTAPPYQRLVSETFREMPFTTVSRIRLIREVKSPTAEEYEYMGIMDFNPTLYTRVEMTSEYSRFPGFCSRKTFSHVEDAAAV